MDETTLRELGTRYDIPRLRALVPREPSVAVRSFDTARLRMEGWRASMTEVLPSADARIRQRFVFDALEAPSIRVAIEVSECASPQDALEALLEVLAGNQLARLEDGPSHLGFVSFQHPPGAPPAIFFARDNLCISLTSFGSRAAELSSWAEQVSRALER
jgi:hypothetical protein